MVARRWHTNRLSLQRALFHVLRRLENEKMSSISLDFADFLAILAILPYNTFR